MPRLVVESGVDKGMVFPLVQSVSTIGRSVSNTIQIIDRRMSRHHAEIHIEGSSIRFVDLGSKNGSYLNEQRVEGSLGLAPGDRIRVGETVLVYEMEQAPQTRPGEITTKALRLVDEELWGHTAGQVRAGADPHLAVRVDASEGDVLKDNHRRLEILYQVADAIRSILDFNDLLERIIDIIFSVVQPDRGYILLRDTTSGELAPRAVKRRDGRIEDEVQISQSIVQKCMSDRAGLLVTDAASDRRFASSQSVVLNRIRSAMCAPLIFKNQVLGVVYVDTQSRIVAYSPEELELLTGIANQSATAIMNAHLHGQLVEQHKLAREMEIARTIQMNLLPKNYPALEGYEISAMSLPAKQVGGDYYDFCELKGGRIGFTIADVSGKGVPAAFLTTLARTYLRSESRREECPIAEMLSRINREIFADVTNHMYVTVVYGVLEPKKGKFRYVNGGHAFPLYISPGKNKVEYLETGGTFLGILEEVEYEEDEITLKPGDVLVLYTDGVTDIQNDKEELWGRENLEKLALELTHMSAEQIRNSIYHACLEHKGDADQFDDFTLIVIKRKTADE